VQDGRLSVTFQRWTPRLLRHALLSTSSLTSPELIAKRLLWMTDDNRPFGTSAAIAARYRSVGRDELRKALVQFCADTNIHDPQSVEDLSNSHVLQTSFAEFWSKRQYFAPDPTRDAIGLAAAMFWAAQALTFLLGIDHVVSDKSIDVPLVRTAMERGAEGLFEVGRSQFLELAQMVVNLVDWLVRDGRKKIVLIEAPLGNSVCNTDAEQR
jgi:hypothetical protein